MDAEDHDISATGAPSLDHIPDQRHVPRLRLNKVHARPRRRGCPAARHPAGLTANGKGQDTAVWGINDGRALRLL